MELTDPLKQIQDELQQWVKQFPERGSTWTSTNQLGDEYITFGYICRHPLDIATAIEAFKKDIQKEVDRTGIISIRHLPEIVLDDETPRVKIRARIVSYRGSLEDEQISPEEWHNREDGQGDG